MEIPNFLTDRDRQITAVKAIVRAAEGLTVLTLGSQVILDVVNNPPVPRIAYAENLHASSADCRVSLNIQASFFADGRPQGTAPHRKLELKNGMNPRSVVTDGSGEAKVKLAGVSDATNTKGEDAKAIKIADVVTGHEVSGLAKCGEDTTVVEFVIPDTPSLLHETFAVADEGARKALDSVEPATRGVIDGTQKIINANAPVPNQYGDLTKLVVIGGVAIVGLRLFGWLRRRIFH